MVKNAKGGIFVPKIDKRIKLTLKDKKILSELTKNSRTSISSISRIINSSKEVTKYRIDRLKRNGLIVNFYTSINTFKLGYTFYQVFVQLKNMNKPKRAKMLKYLIEHPYVFWVMGLYSKWDLFIGIFAKDNKQFENIFSEFSNTFSNCVLNQDISIVTEFIHTSMKYATLGLDFPSKKLRFRRDASFENELENPKRTKVIIDKTDIEILNVLDNSARAPISEIAERVGISRDTVKYRIIKMINQDIIRGFQLRTNHFLLGYQPLTLLMKMKNLKKEEETFVVNYLKKYPLINVILKKIGHWNFSVETYFRNVFDLREFLDNIKDNLGNLLIDYEPIIQMDQYKFTCLPEGVVNELKLKNK